MQLVDTTVEIATKVGASEIVERIVEDLKDESEQYRKMVMETIEKVFCCGGAAVGGGVVGVVGDGVVGGGVDFQKISTIYTRAINIKHSFMLKFVCVCARVFHLSTPPHRCWAAWARATWTVVWRSN